MFEALELFLGLEAVRDRVPDLRVLGREVFGRVCRFLAPRVVLLLCYELMVLGCVSGVVIVDLGGEGVDVVVFWSVELLSGEHEGVDLYTDPEGVEIVDVEDVVFVHKWCCVCSWVFFGH